jgi:hypothetical protein
VRVCVCVCVCVCVSECDREGLIKRRPWPTTCCCAIEQIHSNTALQYLNKRAGIILLCSVAPELGTPLYRNMKKFNICYELNVISELVG